MGDIDAASEALMRQLHRELNGLTRSTRHVDNPKQQRAKALLKARAEARGARRKSNTPCSQDGSGSEHKFEASSSTSEEQEEDRASKQPRRRSSEISPDEVKRSSRQGSPAITTSAGHARKSLDMNKRPPAERERSKLGSKGPHGSSKEKPDETAPPVTPEVHVFSSALEAASFMASRNVRDKVRAAGAKALDSGQRIVKCFHAGVRWGITLCPDALSSRAELATALNDAFAGEILSCGRGEMLNILILDYRGEITEFQSLRGSGARDSNSKWKAAVERAVKIYVRRG
ncbi:hypothetical protein CEUSTIGMA_g1456.t1 [Chlamydomonas eustigma]|uniref:Uncharacterized protein n=1 Tax=Chlamydomonas eustigma TaxID=1157962 RepID=A0A250WTD1_9CHLO|nr:hypothetical protein CEUSTIGMA_g1456.t1 [Chlamydomonas eustigma]|eukprot:GAX74006.1 hypothetical protein CEUSTIGMA_g1456.t1 [Chlamydomonas eustigma]